MNAREFESLAFEEAWRDLVMEAKGTPAPIGQMQRCFPDEYQAARELALGMAGTTVSVALSIQQAQRISLLLISVTRRSSTLSWDQSKPTSS